MVRRVSIAPRRAHCWSGLNRPLQQPRQRCNTRHALARHGGGWLASTFRGDRYRRVRRLSMASQKTVGVLLFEGFELLDVFGPLEAWGIHAQAGGACTI